MNKKNIISIILLICTGITYGQAVPENFINKIWGVKHYYTEFLGQRYVQYSVDSSRNTVDYSIMKYDFNADSSYIAYSDGKPIFTGIWILNTTRDSLHLDEVPRRITQFDEENLIIRSSALQFADTSARLDTAHTYLHLYPVEDIITSVQDASNQSVITMFPNPVANLLTIRVGDHTHSDINLRLINAYGQILKEQDLREGETAVEWNTTSLNKGLYFVQIKNSKTLKITTKTLVKE